MRKAPGISASARTAVAALAFGVFGCSDGLRITRSSQLANLEPLPTTTTTTTTSTSTSTTTTTSTSASTSTSTVPASTTTTTLPAAGASRCAPVPPSPGTVISVSPSQAASLPSIVQNAASGSVIALADGTYNVASSLSFGRSDVVLRSARSQSGGAPNPNGVVINGLNGFSGGSNDTRVDELVRIFASDVSIIDVTLRNARDHVIHVYPNGSTITGTRIIGVNILDPGEQAVKINANPAVAAYPDDGEISCSRIELTATARPWVEGRYGGGCYTGGIDAHYAKGWVIANNTIKGFWCASGLSEHAVHFWTGGRDTQVLNNRIVNCARGVGFGLGPYDPAANSRRNYGDSPCGGRRNAGHYGGLVANNSIFANDPGLLSSGSGFDVGIGLEDACDARVYHNTIVSTGGLFAGVDLRFGNTVGGAITNNFSTHRIVVRDGASSTASGANAWSAPASSFRSLAGDGDLRLLPSASQAIDAGGNIPTVTDDIDGDPRDSMPDLGSDELD